MTIRDLRIAGSNFVRFATGMLLGIAAALKWLQLLSGDIRRSGADISSPLELAISVLELLVGCWLWSGWRLRAAWNMCVLVFSGFAVYSLVRVLRGNSSCGCFGAVRIHPWATFTLDLVVLVGLLAFRPTPEDQSTHRESEFGSRSVWISFCLALVLPLISIVVASSGKYFWNADEMAGDKIVVLKPTDWIGRKLPLLAKIDVGDALAQGRWIVVLYHSDCSKCQEAMNFYRNGVRAEGASGWHIAFIEVTPNSAEVEEAKPPFVYGRLSADQNWFVETPIHLLISDGIVREVSRENFDLRMLPHE